MRGIVNKILGSPDKPDRSAGRKSDKRPATPGNRRLYCIGDIHGRFDLLKQLVQMIEQDAHGYNGSKGIIYLGDYIDRGPESMQVMEFLLDGPPQGFDQVCILGNHDQAMLDFLAHPMRASAWLGFGGQTTLASYGVSHGKAEDPRSPIKLRDALALKIPSSHIEFIEQCPLMHREGDYVFVHAGIRPGRSLDNQSKDDLLWIREDFTRSDEDHGVVVVHGHSIKEQVEFAGNRIGIDTGAFYTGVLTALVLEDQEQRLLQTGSAV